MKVAQNPLSKNLAKIFGSKYNNGFKKKVNEIKENLKIKQPDESIKNWILQKKGNEKLAHRWPSIALLIELADALEMEVWDFFIEQEHCLNLQTISPIKKRMIKKILALEDADRLTSAERAINDQLRIEELEKEKKASL